MLVLRQAADGLRHTNGEECSAARLVGNHDLSALGFDEAFDNRQVRGRCLPRAASGARTKLSKPSATSRAAGRPLSATLNSSIPSSCRV